MTPEEVHALLEKHRDERGIQNWQARHPDSPLRSPGMGLTKLRKLAKQIGRDHALSQALWASDVYEARVVALLVEKPKAITRAQAESQVEQLQGGMLATSSRPATLPWPRPPSRGSWPRAGW